MRIVLSDLDTTDLAVQEIIRQFLYENRCAVTFRKINGDIRTIDGGLGPWLIPTKNQKQAEGRRTFETSCPIFDVHVNQWRAFRWDNLISIALESSYNRAVYRLYTSA